MSSSRRSDILVTGVTGLLGGEVLQELVHRGTHQIAALVRSGVGQSPSERFRVRMDRSSDSAEFLNRTLVLEGNITCTQWALSPTALRYMADHVGTIVHCAADTSFIRNESVADTNIQGTHNLIELARSMPVPPRIIYVSTATNVGCVRHCSVKEDEGCKPENLHHNEYTYSKAVAERLLRQSGLDVMVVRPSIVLSGGINDAEFARNILWFAPLLYEFEAIPVDPRAEIDLISSAYFAKGIVALMHVSQPAYDCYHISAGHRFGVTITETLGVMNRFYHRKPPVLISPDEWTKQDMRQFIRSPKQRKLFHALRYYFPFLNMDVTYDNSRFYETLGVHAPEFNRFESYADQLLGQIAMNEALSEATCP